MGEPPIAGKEKERCWMSVPHLPTTISMIINQYSEAFLKRSRGSIRVTSFVSDMRFDELVRRELEELERVDNPEAIKITHKPVCENSAFLLWNCSMSRKSARVSVEGSFLVLQAGYFIFMLSGQGPHFLRECTMYLAKDMYPNMMVAYITAEEIFEILQRFSKTKEKEFLYSKSVTKRMFGKSFTSLGYATTKEPFTEAFAKARSLGLWIDSIRIISADNSDIDFRLSRSGLLTYYKGSFEEYYDNVLTLMEEYCSRRLKMFEKRGRKERDDREPQPLLLKFDSRVFEDTFVRKQLINVISKYDFCNYSVIHEGNPHVYINVVDRIDNSAFSLRTYKADSLVITPQIKATQASLMRFSKHLMDKFREGKITEFNT